MKILFVSEYYPPRIMGGGEINVETAAKALAKRGNKIFVLTSYHEGLKETEIKEGVTILRRLDTGSNPSELAENVKRSFLFSRSIVKEVKAFLKKEPPQAKRASHRSMTSGGRFLFEKERVDIIHLIGASIIAAPELKESNIPLFATIESYPALCPKGDRIFHGRRECAVKCSLPKFISCQYDSREIGKMKNRWYLKHNPAAWPLIYRHYARLNSALKHCHLIAISGYVQGLLLQQGHKSMIIPNFLDVGMFATTIKNEPRKDEKIKILYLGSLIRSKGPDVLLEAIRGLDVECRLYGEGILKKELRRKIQEQGLPAAIFSPVPYAEIPSLYAHADIVVFPSRWPEPFGRIAIEAMAAGKPVIGSAIGAIKETIGEGAGILVDPGDTQQLREAIGLLMHDPALRKKMGQKGKKIAGELYAEEIVADKLLLMYKSKASLGQNRP